jgi:hypothetical protein
MYADRSLRQRSMLGPALGAHDEDIYCGLLGLAEAELQQLRQERVI